MLKKPKYDGIRVVVSLVVVVSGIVWCLVTRTGWGLVPVQFGLLWLIFGDAEPTDSPWG